MNNIPDEVYEEAVLTSLSTESLVNELKRRFEGYCPICNQITVKVEE